MDRETLLNRTSAAQIRAARTVEEGVGIRPWTPDRGRLPSFPYFLVFYNDFHYSVQISKFVGSFRNCYRAIVYIRTKVTCVLRISYAYLHCILL